MRFCILFLLTAQFCGCSWLPAVGPDYKEPQIVVPANWSTAHEAPNNKIAAWWTQLNDPVLDKLLEQALSANRDLQVAVSRVSESQSDRDIAFSSFFPQTSLDLSADRRRFSLNSFQGVQIQGIPGSATARRPNFVNNSFIGNLAASWEIDLFGGRRRAYEAAGAAAEATEERLNDVLVSLVGEVATNYFEVRALEKRIRIAHENIDSQNQSFEIIASRQKAGLASSLDLSQAKTQLSETRATVPALDAQLVAAKNRLAVVLGVTPDLIQSLLPQAEMPQVPTQIFSGVPSDLLRNRPDIRVAERTLALETANVGIATADLFPKFSITGDLGLQSIERGNFFQAASRAWHLGTAVSLPIFNAGRLTAQLRAAGERASQAVSLYEKTVLSALAEADSSLAAFSQERERLAILREADKAAQDSVMYAREQYTAGLVDLLRVIEAQRSAFSIGDAVAISQQRVAANFVASYKALGFGWQRTLEQRASKQEPVT